ncbi:MAG: glycosyltransferase family 2 protein [Bacteroidales bacterium]|nr:glycosyltransferase family 2 protein [Bacteroidota bacterium]MBL6949964.1 glycosyltransferase family 2 protein [Bacteroidales bacterium]
MSDYRISIVIPCRNEEQYIGRCLQSIINVDYPLQQLEVFVCDGMSNDGTQKIVNEFAREYPIINQLVNHQQTTPQALNLGIKHASGDIIVILGAHSELLPDYLTRCLESLHAHPEAGGVGGILDNQFTNPVSELIGYAMSSSFGVGDAYFRTGMKEGYADTVVFGAYRKEVFEKVGLFDETLVRNQDDEFNFRVLQHGYKLWLDKSVVSKYHVRSSFGRLFKQYFQYGLWKVYVNKKHRTITTSRQLVPFLFILFLAAGAIASCFNQWILTGYLSVIGLYLILASIVSFRLVHQISKIPGLIVIFFVLHMSYGLGYLSGVIKFLFLGYGSKRN